MPKHKKLNLVITQINICGLKANQTELQAHLTENDVDICAIQETKASKDFLAVCKFDNYALFHCDCLTDPPAGAERRPKCQGVAFLIRPTVYAEVKKATFVGDTHHHECRITTNGKIYTIRNVYHSPSAKSKLNIGNKTTNIIILGDMNPRSVLLGYRERTSDALDKQLAEKGLAMLQNDTTEPTYYPRNGRSQPSRPDVTLMTPKVARTAHHMVHESVGSDHLPIVTKIWLGKWQAVKERRYVLKKANWDKFAEITNTETQQINIDSDTLDAARGKMTKAIIKAANDTIPQIYRKYGRVKHGPKLKRAIEDRKQAFYKMKKHRGPREVRAWNQADKKVKAEAKNEKKGKALDQLIEAENNPNKLWTIIDHKSSDTVYVNAPVSHPDGRGTTCDLEAANVFVEHYASVCKTEESDTDENTTEVKQQLKMYENRFKGDEAIKPPTDQHLHREQKISGKISQVTKSQEKTFISLP